MWAIGHGKTALLVRSSEEPQGTHVALALEATTLGTRFTVLASRVLSRSCAIPVAWTILLAHQPHAWRREWLRLLCALRPASPQGWTVSVLADRGLAAGWLFRRIVRLGWHPFWRINGGGTCRPAGQARFDPRRTCTPQVGSHGRGTGTAFKHPQRRLPCTLGALLNHAPLPLRAFFPEPWPLGHPSQDGRLVPDSGVHHHAAA